MYNIMPRICSSESQVLSSSRLVLHRRRHTLESWHDQPIKQCRRLSSSEKRRMVQSPHKRILVTGGAGYIGSHTCLELLNNGYDIVVMDNMVNSNKGTDTHIRLILLILCFSLEALHRVEQLSGRPIIFLKGDITHEDELDAIFQQFQFWAVIHFAAIKVKKKLNSQQRNTN